LIIDLPYSNGIWYDVGNIDGVFTNNWVENVGFYTDPFHEKNVWPSQNGFFFEISKGAVCAGNVFVNCDHGILILNSSNVKVYNNTFVNSMACFGRNERSAQGDHFGWHPSTGPDVDERINHEFVNNLLTSTENYNRPLLFIWQPETLCEKLNEATLKKLDNNVYVNKTDLYPIIWISQKIKNICQTSIKTSEELNNLKPEYAKNSLTFKNYSGPLFKGNYLKNYQLLEGFKGIKSGIKIPDEIAKLKGAKKANTYIGAYPSIKNN
jgi:parallel beta-helix repeat protein